MFKVEIDTDDVVDLVALMARQIGAEFGARTMIETENRRLAFAVASLFGKVVEGHNGTSELAGVRPDADERESEKAFEELNAALDRLAAAGPRDIPGFGGEAAQPARAKVDVQVRKFENIQERTKPKANGFCRYCGDPVGPKVVCCAKRECKVEQNREWQVRYQARKSEGLVGKKVEEVAGSEVPFAGMVNPVGGMRILGGSKTMLEYPEYEILVMIEYGALRDGQQIQDLSTRMLFEVRDGKLAAIATLSKELMEPLPEGAMITLRKSMLGLDPVKSEENHAAA